MGGSKQALFRLIACVVLLALTMCRAQAQTGSLSGDVTLEGLASSAPAQTVTFEFSPVVAAFPANSGPMFVLTAQISTSNTHYFFSGVPEGTYNIGIKGRIYANPASKYYGSSLRAALYELEAYGPTGQ